MDLYGAMRAELLDWVTQSRSKIAKQGAAVLHMCEVLREGTVDQALEVLQQTLHPDPTANDLVAQAMQVGAIYAESASFDELEALLRGATAMLPNQVGWQMALALTIGHNGRPDEGRAMYDELIEAGAERPPPPRGRRGLCL